MSECYLHFCKCALVLRIGFPMSQNLNCRGHALEIAYTFKPVKRTQRTGQLKTFSIPVLYVHHSDLLFLQPVTRLKSLGHVRTREGDRMRFHSESGRTLHVLLS